MLTTYSKGEDEQVYTNNVYYVHVGSWKEPIWHDNRPTPFHSAAGAHKFSSRSGAIIGLRGTHNLKFLSQVFKLDMLGRPRRRPFAVMATTAAIKTKKSLFHFISFFRHLVVDVNSFQQRAHTGC